MANVIRIDALIFLDNDGKRFFAKYYKPKLRDQAAKALLDFEVKLFEQFTSLVDEMKEGAECRKEHSSS